MLGLVVSGGNTILVKINKVGKYEVLAQTVDDALGEALDKGARMLGWDTLVAQYSKRWHG